MEGRSLILRPKQSRLGLLRSGLQAIVCGRPVSGRQLEHVVGHLYFVCLSFHLSLSILSHTYRYMRDCYDVKRPVTSISDRICPYVYMFDASLEGCGVMRGRFAAEEVRAS